MELGLFTRQVFSKGRIQKKAVPIQRQTLALSSPSVKNKLKVRTVLATHKSFNESKRCPSPLRKGRGELIQKFAELKP